MCSPSALSCLLQQTMLRFLHCLSLLKKAWLGSPLIATSGSGYADWSRRKRSVQAESRRCSPGEAGSRSGESDRQVLIKASSQFLMAWGNGGLLDTLLSSSPRAAWVMGRWGTVGSAAPMQHTQYDSGPFALKMVNMRESHSKIVRVREKAVILIASECIIHFLPPEQPLTRSLADVLMQARLTRLCQTMLKPHRRPLFMTGRARENLEEKGRIKKHSEDSETKRRFSLKPFDVWRG
ncbi:hypothetical protein MHYP_G00003210 [Metynnis hypsauchen]